MLPSPRLIRHYTFMNFRLTSGTSTALHGCSPHPRATSSRHPIQKGILLLFGLDRDKKSTILNLYYRLPFLAEGRYSCVCFQTASALDQRRSSLLLSSSGVLCMSGDRLRSLSQSFFSVIYQEQLLLHRQAP